MFMAIDDHKHPIRRLLILFCLAKSIQRTSNVRHPLPAHVCIPLGCPNATMPKQFLDVPDVNAIFQQVSRE